MGLVKLFTFPDYLYNAIRYPVIANNMAQSRLKLLSQNLHFVNSRIKRKVLQVFSSYKSC